MKSLLIFTIVFFGFQGCATQPSVTPSQPETPSSVTSAETTEVVAEEAPFSDTSDALDEALETEAVESVGDDEFGDDFEDEFESKKIEEAYDPLFPYNRIMTVFNDVAITYLLVPASKAYAYVLPSPIRIGVSNFIDNLGYPIRFVNNLLQGKFENAIDETKRFLVNTTFGLAGIMDPATNHLHIPVHDEDFGQTLGYYGMGPGIHVVLPFLGPSNLRDIIGLTADAYVSPLDYTGTTESYRIPQTPWESVGVKAITVVNDTSFHPGEYASFKKDAIDLYTFLRDVYEQKRAADIAK